MPDPTLDPKALDIALEAAEASYLAEKYEGLAFDGAVKAGIVSYLGSLSTPIAAGGGEAIDPPISQLMRDDGEPEWKQINALFLRNDINAFPIRLRDELSTMLAWARYGERAALSPCRIGEETERELLASFMLRNSFATGHGDTFSDLLSELEAQVQERALQQKAWADKWDHADSALRTALSTARAAEPVNIRKTLINCAQIIDVVKGEWEQAGAWSAWDQSVRDDISKTLAALFASPPLPAPEEKRS